MAESKLRTLWLIRHAKATEPTPGQTDAERQLAPRGLADLQTLVAFLSKRGLSSPRWVWASDAVRTRQTAEPLAKLWRSEVIEDSALYLADAYTLLDCLQGSPNSYSDVAMVAHNPGISDLAHLLAHHHDSQSLPRDLATLGLVQLAFQGEWSELNPASCQLVQCLTPKTIPN